MQFFGTNPTMLWLMVMVACSNFPKPSWSAYLSVPDTTTSDMNRPRLEKRARPFIPRIVFIPMIGPITFSNIFDWGVPVDVDSEQVGVPSRIKETATQALSEVVTEYAIAHPEAAKTVSLEMRELWLEESGDDNQQQQKSHRSHPQEELRERATADLKNFFQNHPELQIQVENRFKNQIDNLYPSNLPYHDDDSDDDLPNDWAHINPNEP
ncbi:hypothetical protein VP01_3133g3 [Puccinia sorghi]|uniref:Uncharacterized protein n=1 Tax=Puccinia sorghi TaxID=27349 RepID=A0A0L6UZ29_9BASI|nr:hypothetical protein VP01_3133g3 [Puccinia sorghi]